MYKNNFLNETLEQNNNNIDLAFFNFLLLLFKIPDFIKNEDKIKISNNILALFSFDDYIKIIFDLDEFDPNNLNDKKTKEAKNRIINYIKKYKKNIINYFENNFDSNKYKTYEKVIKKIVEKIKNIEIINEKKEEMDKNFELSKIYKPKINTDILKKAGPFNKDTKSAFLKKNKYDRKFLKHKHSIRKEYE